jgi:hypothetical protein
LATLGTNTKVDKPWPHRLGRRLEQIAHIEPLDDRCGHIPWLTTGPLGQSHRHGARVVPKPGIGRLADLLDEAGQFVGLDRHDPVCGEPLKGRRKHAA